METKTMKEPALVKAKKLLTINQLLDLLGDVLVENMTERLWAYKQELCLVKIKANNEGGKGGLLIVENTQQILDTITKDKPESIKSIKD